MLVRVSCNTILGSTPVGEVEIKKSACFYLDTFTPIQFAMNRLGTEYILEST